MADCQEQRAPVKFCFLKEKSPAEIFSEDLYMRRVAVKFVLRFLIGEQRKYRLHACFELQNQLKEDSDFRLENWWIVGLWIQPRNKAAIKPVEVAWPSLSQKLTKWNQTSRQCVFISSIAKVLCTRSSFSSWTGSWTWRFWKERVKKRAELCRPSSWFFH